MCHFARVGRAQFIYAGEANVRGAASKEGCSMCGGIFAVFAIVRAMRVGGGSCMWGGSCSMEQYVESSFSNFVNPKVPAPYTLSRPSIIITAKTAVRAKNQKCAILLNARARPDRSSLDHKV